MVYNIYNWVFLIIIAIAGVFSYHESRSHLLGQVMRQQVFHHVPGRSPNGLPHTEAVKQRVS